MTEVHRRGRPKTVALIVTAMDEWGDLAFRSLVEPVGVRVFSTRTPYLDDEPDAQGRFHRVTPFDKLGEGFPASERLDMLAFSCTSGTVATGKKEMVDILRAARPGLLYATPGTAMVSALTALDACAIGLVTPYPAPMHALFKQFYAEEGLHVTADVNLAFEEADYALIDKDTYFEALDEVVAAGGLDAVYLSCTGVDVTSHLPAFEAHCGLPVLSSSQVLAWDCLRQMAVTPPADAPGVLFARSRR